MATYTVKKGDTLTSIANKFNTTVSAIQKLNPTKIKNVNSIVVGWVLKVPDTKTTDYTALGKAVEKCLADIEKLTSFKEVEKLLG